jgi:serine/threonine protein kinase
VSRSDISQRIVSDRYALKTPLGRGGMGVVWRAEDQLLRRDVAIKEVQFPPSVPGDEQDAVRARVMREARAAASLNHPGAVAVYDVVQDEGMAFIVMELVDAPTLSDIVRAEGPLSPVRAAEIGLQVLAALEAAHLVGIVHRDVKPGNVMIGSDGRVKLADFGIASVKDDPKLTASGMILGSPSFMAPEQARDNTSSSATDLWALGATLYFAIKGEPAFDKGQAISTLTAVLHDEPDIDASFGEMAPVVSSLLAKEAAGRPAAPELRAMLEQMTNGQVPEPAPSRTATAVAPVAVAPAVPASTVSLTEAQTHAPEPAPSPTPPRMEPRTRPAPASTPRRELDNGGRWLVGLGLLAIAGLAAVLAFGAVSDDPGSRDEQARGGGQGQAGGGAAQDDADDTDGVEDAADAAGLEWTEYEHDGTGFKIDYPEGWDVFPDRGGAGVSVDFQDPASSTYMRVAWTDEPGPDVVARLEDIAATFASDRAGYEELRIEAATFQDFDDAGIWEYLYTDGAELHATNLQFTNEEYGFALNFQSRAEDWDDVQTIREAFETSFEAP